MAPQPYGAIWLALLINSGLFANAQIFPPSITFGDCDKDITGSIIWQHSNVGPFSSRTSAQNGIWFHAVSSSPLVYFYACLTGGGVLIKIKFEIQELHCKFFFESHSFKIKTDLHIDTPDRCCQPLVDSLDYLEAEDLAPNKLKVLENCVVNGVRDAYAKAHDSAQLSDTPPLENINDNLYLSIDGMTMTDVRVQDEAKSVVSSGYVTISWKDSRLAWDKSKFNIDQVRVESPSSIWTPDLQVEDAASSSGSFIYFGDINVTQSGAVSSRATFQMTEDKNCVFNLEDYPNDEVKCCNSFESKQYSNHVKFKLVKATGELKKGWNPPYWTIQELSLDAKESDPGEMALWICVGAKRDSRNLRIEMTIPMAIAAIVLLAAPLFPGLKGQLYVKLFTLLLQFLCFQFLIENTPQISLGNKVPKIHKFYEFTLAMTLVSLIVTLLIMAVLNCKSRIPPSHSISLISTAINNFLCCLKPTQQKEVPVDGATTSTQNGGGEAAMQTPPSKTPSEWEQVWIALNNVLALIIIVVYIIGIIIITS